MQTQRGTDHHQIVRMAVEFICFGTYIPSILKQYFHLCRHQQDYYVDDHWNKMPNAWTKVFENIPPENLAELLTADQRDTHRLWPLSLLAAQSLLHRLCIPREPLHLEYNQVSKAIQIQI